MIWIANCYDYFVMYRTGLQIYSGVHTSKSDVARVHDVAKFCQIKMLHNFSHPIDV